MLSPENFLAAAHRRAEAEDGSRRLCHALMMTGSPSAATVLCASLPGLHSAGPALLPMLVLR